MRPGLLGPVRLSSRRSLNPPSFGGFDPPVSPNLGRWGPDAGGDYWIERSVYTVALNPESSI
jgi:hypothetical protein